MVGLLDKLNELKKTEMKYSILELAMISEGQSVQQTIKNALIVAQEAEKLNYNRIWFAEHHNTPNIGSSATTLLMGYVAENTQSIRIGSGGIMLPNHSPLIIAEQIATLEHLYPGRIDLGLGRAPGTDTQTAHAIRSDFYQAAQNFPIEVAKIEQYFSVENRAAAVRVPMAEGLNVPIYILGSSTDSAHLAAKKGLPYAFASHFASTHLHQALHIYRNQFQPSAVLEKPYTMAGINIYIADTEEEAFRNFTCMLNMFADMFSGRKRMIQAPMDMTDDLWEFYQHPTAQQMLKYSFVGTKDQVKEQIVKFISETGVDELIAGSTMYHLENRLKCFQKFAEIMNEINNK